MFQVAENALVKKPRNTRHVFREVLELRVPKPLLEAALEAADGDASRLTINSENEIIVWNSAAHKRRMGR